nr:MAG TPA: hypothetical protein [Caudoviricetes sp.]
MFQWELFLLLMLLVFGVRFLEYLQEQMVF